MPVPLMRAQNWAFVVLFFKGTSYLITQATDVPSLGLFV